jgi:hypothetical protein
MTLLARQRAFRDYLRDAPNDAAAMIAGNADARLAVYHNAFRARLDDCMRDTFPKCWAYLGDNGFARAAEAHRIATPPHSWTLDAYGAGFDATLARLYPDDAEVAELGWLEWALRRAFDGADAEPLANEQLASIDWDESIPLLHPTCMTQMVSTNAAAIWAAIDTDSAPPAAETLSAEAMLLIWRKGLVPQYRTVTGYELAALRAILGGKSFGAMCAELFAGIEAEAAVPIIGAVFGGWVRDGLVVGAGARS